MKFTLFLSIQCLMSSVLCYLADKDCGQLYPRVIGGAYGDTNASAFDMSSDGGMIAIGGSTNDSRVIMANDRYAFVTLFSGQFMSQNWHKIIQI